jgi:hypothetical protein
MRLRRNRIDREANNSQQEGDKSRQNLLHLSPLLFETVYYSGSLNTRPKLLVVLFACNFSGAKLAAEFAANTCILEDAYLDFSAANFANLTVHR